MVYRARITKIRSWVESHYNLNANRIVTDARDAYIEVRDPDEADLLEAINKTQEKLLCLQQQWAEKYNN